MGNNLSKEVYVEPRLSDSTNLKDAFRYMKQLTSWRVPTRETDLMSPYLVERIGTDNGRVLPQQ